MNRPWPKPDRPFLMHQTWKNLLFAHWPVDPAQIKLPPGLSLDLWEGQAWIGVVPFQMEGVKLRSGIGIPTATAFPELNLRTYATYNGRPGVWFFSLDAGSALAVWGARRFFHLPYYKARFKVQTERDGVRYQMSRPGGNFRGRREFSTAGSCPPEGGAVFQGKYRPTGPAFQAQPGTLAHFLTARYCLYAADKAGGLYRGEIDHEPWTLNAATLDLQTNTVAQAAGITLTDRQPHLLFAKELKVQVWDLERLA
jgi:hypothetical protein